MDVAINIVNACGESGVNFVDAIPCMPVAGGLAENNGMLAKMVLYSWA